MPWAIQWPHIAWDVNTTCEQLHFPNVLGLTRLSPFLRSLSLTALLGSLIVSPHQSSHFSRQSGSLHSFYTRTPLEVHHSQAELNTGTLDPSTRETGLNASSVYLVSSQGAQGCCHHQCSAFLPSCPLCTLPSRSPLLGLSNSPIASASCFHLFGYLKPSIPLRLLCPSQGYVGEIMVSFLQGQIQASSSTPSAETSLP